MVPHTHFSAIGAAQAFVGVVIIGTLWRLSAAHLCNSKNEMLVHVGRAMAFQY